MIEGLKAAQALTIQIMTLSSALIALTVTFAKEFKPVGASSLVIPLALKGAWVSFGVSTFCGIVTLMAITGTLDEIDRGAPETNPRRTNIRYPAILMVSAFLLGLCLTIVAGFQVVS